MNELVHKLPNTWRLSCGHNCWDEIPWPKSSWGGRFNWFMLPNSITELKVRTGTQTWQEPGDGSLCRSHGRILLTDLLSMACLVCFLIESKTTNLGMIPLTMDWALFHQRRFIKDSVLQAWQQSKLMEVFSQSSLLSLSWHKIIEHNCPFVSLTHNAF